MKLRETPIQASDIKEYLGEVSDFAFEMSVLAVMEELRFPCQHGGTYTDPVTGKARQFDIRAGSKARESWDASRSRLEPGRARLVLCVECKNIRDFFPLVVHRVPRRRDEAFHSIIRYAPIPHSPMPPMTDIKVVRVDDTLYGPGEPTGKRLDQVGRSAQAGEIYGSDQDVFEKLSQAIASARDLTLELVRKQDRVDYLVLPVVVVPDGRLWTVDYEENGKQYDEPRQSPAAELYVGQTWPLDIPGLSFTLSHLEIVTIGHLPQFVDSRLPLGGGRIFPALPS